MSQKLSLGAFKWVKNTPQFSKDFTENYNEDSNEGNFLEVDVQYLETLSDLQNDLLFLPEKMKIEKVEKLAANQHNRNECYTHRKFKTVSKTWLTTEKTAVTKFTEKFQLEPYIDMNTKLRKKAKIILKKIFCKLMKNVVFEKKTWEK